jgi:hypothetical protein
MLAERSIAIIDLHWDVYLPDGQPPTALDQQRRVFRRFSDRAELKTWVKLSATPFGKATSTRCQPSTASTPR